jgi:signal transduction histidine kinase
MSLRRRTAAHRRRPQAEGRLPATMGGSVTNGQGGQRAAADPARIVEILSHELRSPITTIHLGTKVLRGAGRGISAPVRNEVVAAVEEEAERLYRLVEDLLAVARHDAGGPPLPAAPLLLQHWLPGVVDAEIHAEPRLRVRMAIPPDLPPVVADDGALAQVLRNLLRNAVRYAADGMPVEVVADRAPGGMIALEVLDRGPGLATDEADRLFEPFYRAEAAEAFGSGAGLGLAAARSLLRAMGGTIEALPRDGGGARFTVRLPMARADEEAERA